MASIGVASQPDVIDITQEESPASAPAPQEAYDAAEDSEGDDDDDLVYEVEKIIDERDSKAGKEYLIKWVGWGPKYNTWEPSENIIDPDLVSEFEARKAAKAARQPKKEELVRNEALFSEFTDDWLVRYSQKTVANLAGAKPDLFSIMSGT